MHTQCLLLLVDWLCWTCVFTGQHKRSFIKSKFHVFFTTTSTEVWTSLPHEHLGQTFGIWKIKRENVFDWLKRRDWWQPGCPSPLLSPLSLFSLCSRLLLLNISSPVKITTIPTNTQEIVTIIFKPSPPPDLWSLTFGAFTIGAMVPVEKQQYLFNLLKLRLTNTLFVLFKTRVREKCGNDYLGSCDY